MSVINRKGLLEVGAHFGHKKDKLDARMKKYVYGIRGGVHIIDLEKTIKAINRAYDELKNIVDQGGKVLFVGTKKQAADSVKECADKCSAYYVNSRWLGGTLTNHRTVMKSLDKLEELENMDTSTLTKKEISNLEKKKEKLQKSFSGIRNMRKLPDAVFVVSAAKDGIAIDEARKLNIPVFAITDTDVNPDVVDYPIPANDDAIRSIALILDIAAKAILRSQTPETEVINQPSEEVVIIEEVVGAAAEEAVN